jgi:hypothetical protein
VNGLVSNAIKSDQTANELADEAFRLMEQAQLLLDRAGLTQAAAHLDYALGSIPDASGNPRMRNNPPLTL